MSFHKKVNPWKKMLVPNAAKVKKESGEILGHPSI